MEPTTERPTNPNPYALIDVFDLPEAEKARLQAEKDSQKGPDPARSEEAK